MVSVASAGARLVGPFLPRPGEDRPKEILVLRLDRIGDVLMSLPAMVALREALPEARIRLAVGEWSREIAQDAPVDEVLVWSAPWVGRPDEGAVSFVALFKAARSRRSRPPDLAIDLQGDVRAIWLMAATGASERVGYANTGSAALLSAVVELDENISLVEQNYRAMETALGRGLIRRPFAWLDSERRSKGREFLTRSLSAAGLRTQGPIVGLHPGAGRRIKEWPLDRYVELGRRLSREKGATLVLTGSAAERPKTAAIKTALPEPTLDLGGQLNLAALAETMSACDAFVSGDTAAMHFACALGLPSVAIFGPSDPGRYFSGGEQGFGLGQHMALSSDLWCRPCNLIRRPPRECDSASAPECLLGVTTDSVFKAIVNVLSGSR
ncbi:MAG: glycosyltransferase family 9 protein [Vicinamibacteria bacterium]|nr:glycosyltransferase family 9 protein [Vicinamibacteria bacterium]